MTVPANLDAERAVLGAILLSDETCLPQVLAQGLRPEDFYWEQNGRVFDAMVSMYEDRRHVDSLTLGVFMKDRAMVDDLAAAPFSAGHVSEYARIVIEQAFLRRIVRAAYDMLEAVERGDLDGLRLIVGGAVALLPKGPLKAVGGREAA